MGEESIAPAVSIVVIGRNEGRRLQRCLESIFRLEEPKGGCEVFYVDTESTDGSLERARRMGVRTLRLRSARPTPAAARNRGLLEAQAPFVFFVDADCIIDSDFLIRALRGFADPRVAVVFGRLREIDPTASPYSRVMDLDWWNPLPGPTEYCAGVSVMRRAALDAVGGFDEAVISAEEPELCLRLRLSGWTVLRLDCDMARHELAMTRFSQYWRRAIQQGYGAMLITDRVGRRERWDKHRAVREARLVTTALIAAGAAAAVGVVRLDSWLPLAAPLLAFGGCASYEVRRSRPRTRDVCTLLLRGVHFCVKQFPALIGHLLYFFDKRTGYERHWISYK